MMPPRWDHSSFPCNEMQGRGNIKTSISRVMTAGNLAPAKVFFASHFASGVFSSMVAAHKYLEESIFNERGGFISRWIMLLLNDPLITRFLTTAAFS